MTKINSMWLYANENDIFKGAYPKTHGWIIFISTIQKQS